jgi:ABC-type transport system substrate-binding protein
MMMRGLGETHDDKCKVHELDFIMIEGDANLLAVEDNIREHLKVVGFDVKARKLSKEEFNAAHQSGDFHLSFTETWGAPYDPHSYASGWIAGDEGHKQAMSNMEVTRDSVFSDIEDVLKEDDRQTRETKWKEVLNTVHQQAVMLPLWGKRVPTVLNDRLVGYEAGSQQFDYPVHKLKILEGEKSVTIAPGAQTGLFQSVGRLDPHSYRPNEFFSNNWVYEGLVGYSPHGQVVPALAKSWTVKDNVDGGAGQTYTFVLRENVKFHDGSDWNCEAAKQNFDHCLAEPLRSGDYHGWYGVPKEISGWSCNDDGHFVVEIKSAYYPFLQELSFIRPLRMLSPANFKGDAVTANSCPEGWGTVSDITCAGVSGMSGTGPFVYSDRTSRKVDDDTTVDDKVIFLRNENYWGGASDVEELHVVRYETSDDVKKALYDGTLDVVWGAGVLPAKDLTDIGYDDDSGLSVFHTGDIQNALLLLNSGKAPLDDIALRKAVIHAVDKQSIIESELGGDTRVVDNIFPVDAPYCDVDLTPRWDYDLEKARFLNCNDDGGDSKNDDGGDSKTSLAVGLGVGLGAFALVASVMALYFMSSSNKYKQELDGIHKNEKASSA